VANAGTNSVLVYANASALQGGVAPVRTLAGSDTKIGGISHLWLDTQNDRLWVVDPITNSLLVFNSASALNGNIPPARIITGSNTRLQAPQSILLVGRRLYVACTGSILRFEDADALTGNIAPTAVLGGLTTGLSRPQQMALRADKDELYVADAGAGALFVFANASTANGAVVSLRRIQGPLTNFLDITGLVLDFSP
jgi:DNA-binding beta-propeller fold protein YncE